MNYQTRPPLTATERARRAAVLAANQPAAANDPIDIGDSAEAPADQILHEPNGVRIYGQYAAEILRNSKRDVALASMGEDKISAFRRAATSLSEAVAGQWLPKDVIVDQLQDIAVAHNSFGLSSEDVQVIIAEAVECSHISVSQSPSKPPKRRLISRRASDIQPERLEHVWPGRIARGKLTLIGGPPGLGKSQATINMAATVSISGQWPCDEGQAPLGDVIILSAEDGTADTIIPRLMAAAANRQRIHIVDAATKIDGTGRKTFSLKTDVDLLEEMSREIGTVVLIIIDLVSAYMGGADGNGNVETREVLEPLADMANRLGIAVVAVTHLNKGGAGSQSALNRFAGSIAFVAAARSAYLIVEDPEDENRRLFLQAKNNLAPKSKGLAFRVEQRLIADGIVASNISWESDHVMASVDEALLASETKGGGESRSGKDEAADFLRDALASGPVDVSEVETMARSAGLLGDNQRLGQNKAFQNARKELGITSDREGFGKGARYVLRLPSSPCAPENTMCAPFQNRAHMTNPGAHEGSETSS